MTIPRQLRHVNYTFRLGESPMEAMGRAMSTLSREEPLSIELRCEILGESPGRIVRVHYSVPRIARPWKPGGYGIGPLTVLERHCLNQEMGMVITDEDAR